MEDPSRAVINLGFLIEAGMELLIEPIGLFTNISNILDKHMPALCRAAIEAPTIPEFGFRMQMILRQSLYVGFK